MDKIMDDTLVYFFKDIEAPKGRIENIKCWRCETVHMCFIDESGPAFVGDPSTPIPVCMKCRLRSCGKNHDGTACERCLAFGYPARPEFDRKTASKIASDTFDSFYPNSCISSQASLERWDNFYEREEDCFYNEVEYWRDHLGMCEQCNHPSREEDPSEEEDDNIPSLHPHTDACPDMECTICSERDCPRGEPLHYHHDGCPVCDT